MNSLYSHPANGMKRMIEKDNVWMTSKIRMQAEQRYRIYGLSAHLLITYYAVLLIIISVFSDYLTLMTPYLKEISLSVSIVLLVSTLVAWGFGFERTAGQHRECYLKLKRLYSELKNGKSSDLEYHDILSRYPNHLPKDYEDFIIYHRLVRRKELSDEHGPIDWSIVMIARKFLRMVSYWFGLIGGLVIAPIIVLICS